MNIRKKNIEKTVEDAKELGIAGGISLGLTGVGYGIARKCGAPEDVANVVVPYVITALGALFKLIVRSIRNRRKHK